jgi:AhpD family alkylhydroperoxidase
VSHYYDQADIRHGAALRKAAPIEFAAFAAFSETATTREDGAVPRKYRELIAIGVALTTQCPYCIEAHVKGARRAGATPEELAETVLVAGALRAGGAIAHGRLVMKALAEEAKT